MAILPRVDYFGERLDFFKEFPNGVTFDEFRLSHLFSKGAHKDEDDETYL